MGGTAIRAGAMRRLSLRGRLGQCGGDIGGGQVGRRPWEFPGSLSSSTEEGDDGFTRRTAGFVAGQFGDEKRGRTVVAKMLFGPASHTARRSRAGLEVTADIQHERVSS